MEITINRASPNDAAEILSLLKRAGGETDNLTFGPEGLPYTIDEEADYILQNSASQDNLMLVARIDGKAVGISSLNRCISSASKTGDFSVTVLKDYWNRGVGRNLTLAIVDFATENGFDFIDLDVRCDNERAIRLYEKIGFEKTKAIPLPLKKNGEEIPLIHMSLELSKR